MKFEEYLQKEKFFHDLPKLPKKIEQLEHIFLYGPAGAGKYTQMLRLVSQYSKSKLKYERRVVVPTTIQPHVIKISDIHYEVNMELLGCNAKAMWHDIFTHIMEMIQNKYPFKTGIIVCTNFHSIHGELLEIFYSYMQTNIKFILLSEAISFIPRNIVERCKVMPLPKPSVEKRLECSSVAKTCHWMETVASKNLVQNLFTDSILAVRDHLYHILVHNMNAELCLWYVFKEVSPTLDPSKMNSLILEWCSAMNLYTRNYRPLFHLEHFIMLILVSR